jgi:MFS family permease
MTPRWPALAYRDFRRFLAVRLATTSAINIQTVAVGWQVYDLSREPLYLGLIGLMQFAPGILLVLVTGTAADRFERRWIVAISLIVLGLAAIAFLALTIAGAAAAWPFLLIMGVVGLARAFLNPAMQALIPNLVRPPHLGNAVALNTIAARTGASLGPLAGGYLYALSGSIAYLAVAAIFACAGGLATAIERTDQLKTAAGVGLQTLTAGLSYIWRTKAILGAISFDFFAVLMGGVTALLPLFARDILDAGPFALGVLRTAPAVGGTGVALYLSLRPIRDRAGILIFATMAVFGVSIVLFGMSTVLWLSVAALVVMGASDMANVYFRWTLVQLWTPDAVRGRVASVTSVSATGSTELGDFRAGVSAALFGAVPAVVLGGVMILAGVFVWMRLFPQLLNVRSLDRLE